ncbi:nucleotide-binding alpha-beta plait domain-containing protein [Tanacetum coccineum]
MGKDEDNQRSAADVDWQKVTRKHRGFKTGEHNKENTRNNNWHEGKRRFSDFDKVIKDKAISFFFTNFPESWDTSALWKMFSRYGSVVDVYVAFKKTKRDTRFGFVRFINIGDVVRFESRLKGILIGNEKLVINKAKFKKVGGIGVPVSDFQPLKSGPRPNLRVSTGGQSFREAVLGSKISHPHPLHLDEDPYLKSRLKRCWTAKYIGGLSFLFEWESKESTSKSLEANMLWLQNWFDDLKLWEDNVEQVGRLTWINVEGLPTLARNIGAVKSMVKEFGRILEIGGLDFDSKIHSPIKVLVLRPCMNEVSGSIEFSLNGKTHMIRVFEERFNAKVFISSSSSVIDINDDNRDFKDSGSMDSESEEDSPFEDEFVGPTLLSSGDGISSGGQQSVNGENEKSSPFRSPRGISRASCSTNFENDRTTKEEKVENSVGTVGCMGTNGSKSNINVSQVIPDSVGPSPIPFGPIQDQDSSYKASFRPLENLVNNKSNAIRKPSSPVPDLNLSFGQTINENQGDSELDELLSSFQRISDNANHIPSNGGKKRSNLKMLWQLETLESLSGISINCNGLGADRKIFWIKSLIEKHSPIFMGIQETKIDTFDSWVIKTIWPHSSTDFAFENAMGASGGILTMWNSNIFFADQRFSDRNYLAVVGNWVGIPCKIGLLNVYAPQSNSQKVVLWAAIESLVNSIDGV